MKVTFLEAEVPLTKTFYMQDGKIEKIGHPRILNYTSHEEDHETIEQLHTALIGHSNLGHCFLKGNLARALVKEPRAGTTNPNAATRILLLDIDGIKGMEDVDSVMSHLKLSGVDYIVQYSSSMGVLPARGLSAHIFVLLNEDASPAILKQYLIQWNLTNPLLRENLGLTATYNALRWSLDITTCQNDKLIYIAPPLLQDGVEDNFEGERIQLVKGKSRHLVLPKPFPNAEANRDKQQEALNELRAQQGLKERAKTSMKSLGSSEYLVKPDQAVVTGVKISDEYTYLNLNGGDSWGYWHYTDDPRLIRNFKNEPNYLTSELVPDYWRTVKETVPEVKEAADGKTYLAFRDFRTATYYNGTYDSKSRRLNIAQAKNASQLSDFMTQYDQPVPDPIRDWTLTFNPSSTETIDVANRVLNQFQPSSYMLMKPAHVTKIPPVIRKIIFHMVGNDEESFEHLMNSLAVIMQYRSMTGTAWVFHGIEGTGKGLFLNKILTPLLGMSNVTIKRMREVDSTFNDYMENTLVLWIDEAEQPAFSDKATLMNADIKNCITEPQISLRKMYQPPRLVPNYLTWFLASNKSHITEISTTDRRFNVAVFQPFKLQITDAEIRQLDDELMEFYSYLMTRKASQSVARTPLNNPAKSKMAEKNLRSVDVVAGAILSGDIEYLKDQMFQGDIEASLPRFKQDAAKGYNALVAKIDKERPSALLREELYTIIAYTVDTDVPSTPVKFGQYCRHHKLEIQPIKRDGKSYRGIPVKWKDKE